MLNDTPRRETCHFSVSIQAAAIRVKLETDVPRPHPSVVKNRRADSFRAGDQYSSIGFSSIIFDTTFGAATRCQAA
jgi:hypothetical protein